MDLDSVSFTLPWLRRGQFRQMQHTITRKEDLLRLYASEQEEDPATETGGGGGGSISSNPGWVQVLTDECRELRESNLQLQEEADKLRTETAAVELKEKELVQQCLEQFSESPGGVGMMSDVVYGYS